MRHPTLLLFVSALRLTACASDPPGTLVEGSINLVRSDGVQTGQTGFLFPDRTLLGEGPFLGSCTIERSSGGSLLTISIERAQPDEFGLSLFELEAPIGSETEGSAEVAPRRGLPRVAVRAGGISFGAASGGCAIEFTEVGEVSGQIGFHVDCEALAGADGGQASLDARLNLDFCETIKT